MEGKALGAPNRVYLLVSSPDAPGGIARATATLANHLVQTHRVEMIGLRRRDDGWRYPLDPRVKVTCVVDQATPSERLLEDLPSEIPGVIHKQGNSALVDHVLPRVLAALPPGIVISTRPALHQALARHAPAHCITIGQDHANLRFREVKAAVDLVAEAITRLDQYLVLTEADAESHRRMFPEAADRIRVVRNPAPWPISTSVEKRRKIVVAAGQLTARKGFDLLIEAYRPIAKRRPGWQLHIYGEGPQRKELSRQIAKAGLRDSVILQGRTDDMEHVLEEASIMALTSRYEGLPMVLIEAMTKGVPIVSVDCPSGPAEIVVDGVTGRLVPNHDAEAFRTALLGLMRDPELRARMSQQSLRYAERYEVDRIARSWLVLFDDLQGDRALDSVVRHGAA